MQCVFPNEAAQKSFGGRTISTDLVHRAMQRFSSFTIAAIMVSSLSLAGCESALQGVLPGPTPEPTPTVVPTARPDVFDPNDGVTTTNVTKLNDSDPASAALPDKFRVTRVDAGDLIWIQSVTEVQSGNPPKATKVYGKPDIARLAGVFVPAPGQPGWAETVAKVQSWTLGQEVDVEQDAKYPTDLKSRRLVQIFFTGREGKTKGQRLLLNRMLVRLGYAVVDLHAPTSIDVKPWLNDEEYARKYRLGFWNPAKGIVLGQRIPIPAPKGSKLQIRRVGVKDTSTTRTRRRQNVTTSSERNAPPGAPGAPSGASPYRGPAAAPSPGAPGMPPSGNTSLEGGPPGGAPPLGASPSGTAGSSPGP